MATTVGTDFLIKYFADISGAVKGAKDLELANKQVASNIEREYGQVAQIIGTTQSKLATSVVKSPAGKDVLQQVETQSQVVKTLNGNYLELTKTISVVGDAQKSVSATTKDVTNQFKQTSVESEKASKNAHAFGVNLKNLLIHAVTIIPVWTALRGIMEGVSSSFRNSIVGIIETDTALQKVKRSLTGTAEEIQLQFDTIKKESEKLAVTTGITDDKIIASFQKFAQSGFNFETSMAGARLSTQLAITTFSDIIPIADSIAGAFRALVDTTGRSGTEIEQLGALYGQLNELSKTNKISTEEFGSSLAKFVPTAKANNFSLQQTIALLATLQNSGIQGTTSATLLRTSINKLVENLDKLAPTLGVKVNPALDSMFTVLLKVLDATNQLRSATTQLSPDMTEAFADIFGGARSSQAIQALVSMREILIKNLGLKGDVQSLNDEYEKTSTILGNQVQRFHQLNGEMGKAFLTGLLGAENWDEALGKVNATLEKMLHNAESFGKDVKGIFTTIPIIEVGKIIGESLNFKDKLRSQITEALKGSLNTQQLTALLSNLLNIQTAKIDIGIKDKSVIEYINLIRTTLLKQSQESIAKEKEKTGELNKQAEFNKQMLIDGNKQNSLDQEGANILLKKSEFLKLEGTIKSELAALGLSEVEVEKRMLAFKEASALFTSKEIILQRELVSHVAALEEIELRRSRARGLVDTQLEILKLQGATNLQVLQTRIELEKMYGINQTRNDLLRNELELNKEITKEKIHQNQLSSTTLKLFEISKQFGKQAATTVSEFLTGNIPLQAFETGGKFSNLMKVLEKFFSPELEQRKATEFFFQGQGREIPIPERRAIEEFRPLPITSINIPPITTSIGNINVEIKKLFSEKDTSKQILDAMLDAIRNNAGIQSAIEEQIENY